MPQDSETMANLRGPDTTGTADPLDWTNALRHPRDILALVLILILADACHAARGGDIAGLLRLPWILRLLLLVSGLALLSAGYHIYEAMIALPGFILGLAAGGIAMRDHHWVAAVVVALVLGLILAGLALFLYKLLVFLSGALVASMIVAGISLVFARSLPDPILVVIGGVLGGVATLIFWKVGIVVVSSATGALAFALGTETLHTIWFPVVLTVAGICVQYGLLPKLRLIKEPRDLPGRGENASGNQESPSAPQGEVVGPSDSHDSAPKEICPFCGESSYRAANFCENCGRAKR